MLNIDTARSYATEELLMKALKKRGLDGKKPLVVRNREGRWTAIFALSLSDLGGNVCAIAREGFMTLG